QGTQKALSETCMARRPLTCTGGNGCTQKKPLKSDLLPEDIRFQKVGTIDHRNGREIEIVSIFRDDNLAMRLHCRIIFQSILEIMDTLIGYCLPDGFGIRRRN